MAKTVDPAIWALREASKRLQALASEYGYKVEQSLMTGRWRLLDPEKRPVTNHDGTFAFSYDQAVNFFQRKSFGG